MISDRLSNHDHCRLAVDILMYESYLAMISYVTKSDN